MPLKNAIAMHEHGDLDGSAAGYRQVLARDPTCHQALHGLGLVMHQQGHHDVASSLIAEAIKLRPQQADYRYHLAEVQRVAGRCDEAIDAYREAIHRNPTDADYHFGLGNALAEQGLSEESLHAFEKAAALAPEDAEIHNNLGNVSADLGDTARALEHLQKAIQLSPVYAEAHHNLAVTLEQAGRGDEALGYARRACELDPGNPRIWHHLGSLLAVHDQLGAVTCCRRALKLAGRDPVLLSGISETLCRCGDVSGALDGYRQASEVAPTAAPHHVGIGYCLTQLHRYDEAETAIRKALELDPDSAEAHLNLGVCLQTRGEFEQAVQVLRRSLELQPTLTDAAYLLATNGGCEITGKEFERWNRLRNDPALSEEKRSHLNFALGKVCEKRQDNEKAFEYFQLANRIKNTLFPFDPHRHEDYVNRIMGTFTSKFFEQRRGFGLSDDRLVFIVGMPRSGSTLVEQIIASHYQAYAAGEHLEMREILRNLPALIGSDRVVPDCCEEVSRDDSVSLARRYLDSLPDGSDDAVRVTDKMLGNFLRLGVIALLFPRSRIVHCLRDPIDTCVSCYTQDFAHGLRFTTDLEHLASFYRSYRALMAHWQEVLPLPILNVSYESLIDDQAGTSRKLIDFCDLPWDENCLQPHRTRREIATASFWQARQPVYRSSVSRWRHYEKFIDPLLDGLATYTPEERS